MKQLIASVLAAASMSTIAPVAEARAGTLLRCEGISTPHGYKYVGTYCVDFQCQYVTTRVFDTYCPYSI